MPSPFHHHDDDDDDDDTQEGRRLDPVDWEDYRATLHRLVDVCVDRMRDARDHPWRPPPSDFAARVALPHPRPTTAHAAHAPAATTLAASQTSRESRLGRTLVRDILPTATGNTHPRFFGWVHGTGLPVGVAAQLVADTMNSNVGGRHHGAVLVECAVVEWTLQVAGFPTRSEKDGGKDTDAGRKESRRRRGGGSGSSSSSSSSSHGDSSSSHGDQDKEDSTVASGILTTGTSQATLVALCAARVRVCGTRVRECGATTTPLRVYVAQGAHSCIRKALQLMGHGSEAVREVPVRTEDRHHGPAMDVDALLHILDVDAARGIRPLAIVGTAGSVNVGSFDTLDRIADVCAQRNIWFHVDGAFGFWTLLLLSLQDKNKNKKDSSDNSDSSSSSRLPWSTLAHGLSRADSVATDYHKWIGVPYACGVCLLRDKALHRQTFGGRPPYLATTTDDDDDDGSGGGGGLAGQANGIWLCDYGTDLSRGFSALKVWAAIKALGTEQLGRVVADNCRQARLLGELVEASDWLDLVVPVVSNVCCFTPRHGTATAIAAILQESGEAVFSTTVWDGVTCLRAALVNHRTTRDDIRLAVAAVERVVQELQD